MFYCLCCVLVFQNLIGERGGAALAWFVFRDPSSESAFTNIKELYLGSNQLGDVGVGYLVYDSNFECLIKCEYFLV